MVYIPVWALFILLFVAWFLWLFACMAEVALTEARKGVPQGQGRLVSIFPGIPIFPLAFWGIALLIDQFFLPWGTNLVAGIHLGLSILWLVSAIRDTRKLAKIEHAT